MRIALGAALVGILLVSVSACGEPPLGGPLVMDFLISQQGGNPVPVGLYQTIGVLIPGSGRGLAVTGGDQASAFPAYQEPDGASLLTLSPKATAGWGKPFHYGGTLGLVPSTNMNYTNWTVTIQIATDPLSGHDPHTYIGSGTTVMQVGQTFIMAWPVGAEPPTTSNAGVLTPLGDAFDVFVATQPSGKAAITHGAEYMEQLFEAVATGNAVLSAPGAFDPRRADLKFGPSQRFIVRDDPRWACSPARGCATADAAENNSRPDRYFPAGVAPSV